MPFPKTRAEMEDSGYKFDRNEVCRGCHQRMEMWATPARKRIPMDPMPESSSPAVSHFATCPNASRFRRGKR
jgi:hypothetical protein